MCAIIETGGKQYKVSEGDVVFIEKLPQEAGETVKFDKVLALLGDKPVFGAPVVEGASVDASVVKNGKGKKVVIFKYKPKKGYRLRQGHRQPYTKVEIKKINEGIFRNTGRAAARLPGGRAQRPGRSGRGRALRGHHQRRPPDRMRRQ